MRVQPRNLIFEEVSYQQDLTILVEFKVPFFGYISSILNI